MGVWNRLISDECRADESKIKNLRIMAQKFSLEPLKVMFKQAGKEICLVKATFMGIACRKKLDEAKWGSIITIVERFAISGADIKIC